MPWLVASRSVRRDSGSWTLQSSCRSVAPGRRSPPRRPSAGPTRIPTSTSRMTGGTAKMTAATIAVNRRRREQRQGRDQVDERRHRLGGVEERPEDVRERDRCAP